MNDYLRHLAATTLNPGEVIQPRLPSRFASFRQRFGPIDVPHTALAQLETPPVSHHPGTAIPVIFAEPHQGLATSVAQTPTPTPEHGVQDVMEVQSSPRIEAIRPSVVPPSPRVRERQRPDSIAPEKPTPVHQGITATPDQPGPETVGPRAHEAEFRRQTSAARNPTAPNDLGRHEQGRGGRRQGRANTTPDARPLTAGEQPRPTEPPGDEIDPRAVPRASSHHLWPRLTSDAGEPQHIDPPEMPTRLPQEEGSPQDVVDLASPHTVQPPSQPTGIAQFTLPNAERGTPVSSPESSPAPRHDPQSWTRVLSPQFPHEPMMTSPEQDEPRPVIRVVIGRVEVKAHVPPPRARSTPRKPSLSLNAYLQQRREGRR
jgi:hypothetical protein